MKLAYWMYAGPAHIGTLRVITSFKNVHAIMHAPLGDDYFNVMRSMLERTRDFTSVTASVVDRHVLARGSQEKVVENIKRKDQEEQPDLIVLTPTCTSSILQEDLENFVIFAAQESDSDLLLADVNHYRVNEFQAADRTLEQIVRFYIQKAYPENPKRYTTNFTLKPSANIIGIFSLGFHHPHDCRELIRLLTDLGIQINQIIPEGTNVKDLKNLPKAWFNIVPYREVGLLAADFLKNEYGMPYIAKTPIGILDTNEFIRQIYTILKNHLSDPNKRVQPIPLERKAEDPSTVIGDSKMDFNMKRGNEEALSLKTAKNSGCTDRQFFSYLLKAEKGKGLSYNLDIMHWLDDIVTAKMTHLGIPLDGFINYMEKQSNFVSQATWFSRSIDCQNLIGKKAVVFGDATHAASITKLLGQEMGIRVACAGTYCKHDANWFRTQVRGYCDEVLITDDHTQVGDMIARLEPAAIFGTQMERHIGKRLDIPCGVISSPVHIQNYTLGYRPFLGYEGTNQIADLVYNTFTLGMEDHLLEIFGGHDTKSSITKTLSTEKESETESEKEIKEENEKDSERPCTWTQDALLFLNKIPRFARGKAIKNTERFAKSHGIYDITVEVIYAAKEDTEMG